MMTKKRVLIVGSGHLAFRIKTLAAHRELDILYFPNEIFSAKTDDETIHTIITRALRDIDLSSLSMVYLVDDQDEQNLEILIALISLSHDLPVTASLFNENIAPHLRAAHPHIDILNPAKVAAQAFVDALDTPIEHSLHYSLSKPPTWPHKRYSDKLLLILAFSFLIVVICAIFYFHFSLPLSWLDAVYFVVTTVATVGYGDVSLIGASQTSKIVDIALILGSMFFVWTIFSLTVDALTKKRVELSLGRKKYTYSNHVILCGLGRLGYSIAEGLLARGERVLIVEKNEHSPTVEYLRHHGAEVYIGDARLPRVLEDVGVSRAKALYSVINNDYANLEIGLSARSLEPNLRLILRIFDTTMSDILSKSLDIHLAFSMSAIADSIFLCTIDQVSSPINRNK